MNLNSSFEQKKLKEIKNVGKFLFATLKCVGFMHTMRMNAI